ncbi:MAG: DUF3299 domain-containing protein [Cryomorphaceae bacterium]|jgi:hypothetical protein|nr:MAG: DUF3299 domain-containing protein [Cryomorphaceae bacterium]|tara:strand:- start:234 stop:668 length:435 start_codon:yes stop_codon:yes gene_type:complete
MNKLIYILVLFISNNLFSQTEIDWLKLRDVYYKSEYREDVDGYFQTPYFGETVELLDNKEVVITGYMLTLAPDEGIYVLSQNPYADCFFCGYGGPESAIELRLKPGHDSFFMDELVTVVGILRLNRLDVSSGVYIMDNAIAIKK